MFFDEEKNELRSFTRRSLILFSAKALLLSTVGWKIFDLQINQSNKYKTLSKSNRINIKIIFPIRGIIEDYNGQIVASNYETYELYIIPEEIDDLGNVLKNLSKIISIPFKQRKKVVSLSKKVKKFQMIKVMDNLNWSQLEKIESNMVNLPGVHLFSIKKRYYPQNRYFSHIIGYTSKPSKEDLSLPYLASMPSLEIGKTGIEKQFNERLIGIPGSREIEVNSVGKEIREISKTTSTKGKKVKLSVDLRIQKEIYNQIKNHQSGAVVVMNIHSGEILGMVSFPDFNPNKLINKPNLNYWETILNNPLAPLNNRTIQGLYAPGSTFKMIVALAGLEKNLINLNDSIYCEGKIELGEKIFHCWKTKGHGRVNLLKGIIESCDCYFYELSKKIGIDNIAIIAKKFGLGKLTNLELPSEKRGIVPNRKWKKQELKENWYQGETLIAGIGQGYLLSTPIQLARMTAVIANGGYEILPTLIKKDKPLKEEYNKIKINNDNLNIIKKAMVSVVNQPKGTAYRSRSDSNKYKFAGKTGTSQVKRISLQEREREDFRKKEIEWKDKDHALFVGFMPTDKPKYAISVIIEHGGSGSSAAAPVAKEIFNKLYKIGI